MKKRIILSVSILFFCIGLLCLHLAAQTEETENAPLSEAPIPLVDRNLDKCSEQELLELKVDTYRKIIEFVVQAIESGAPGSDLMTLQDVQADLASAEIELYRCTGELEKLRVALQEKVDARKRKVMASSAHYEVGSRRITLKELCEAEVQLLDAVLEQKRVLASLNEK